MVEQSEILDRYKNFLKEINILHSTIEEKEHLRKIDFDDSMDLDSTIPFLVNKIKDITEYYKSKREDLKNQTTKNKIVGTTLGLKQTIRDFTVNYILNLPNAKIEYDIEDIKTKISVEIEELFDTYSTYFNQTPDENIYDYKDLDYGLNIFLREDSELIREIFSQSDDDTKNLKEVYSLFELKRRETKKYMGVDFYYLSTGDSKMNFLSGKLFDADKPVTNLANQKYPTVASTPKQRLRNLENIGFFRPQKSAIILLDGETSEIRINTENLKPNTLYYFSDPSISTDSEILEVVIDNTKLAKNETSGYAMLEPSISKHDTTFHGYYSEPYIDNEQRFFQELFDKGYVKDLKKDSYGNIYGLFTDDNNFKLNIKSDQSNDRYVKSLILNGHRFYDNVYGEGFAFDYDVIDTAPTNFTTRSGVVTNTGDFSPLSGYYTMFGRYFEPYDDLVDPRITNIKYSYYDGGFISNVEDPVSSDLETFPTNDFYYYNLLIECGVHTANPLQRALNDPSFPSITANSAESFIPDEINTFDIDCGRITDKFVYDYSFDSPNYYYDDTTSCISQFSEFDESSIHDFIERRMLPGKIFVKNVFDGSIDTIDNAIPYMSSIYSSENLNDVTNNTISFEIAEDVLSIETKNIYTLLKLNYDGEKFITPKKSPLIYTKNVENFKLISERFVNNGKFFYNKIETVTEPLSSEIDINIQFYSTDIDTLNERLLHDTTYRLSSNNVVYSTFTKPTLALKRSMNMFNMSFLLKDQNHNFDIFDLNYSTTPFRISQLTIHNNTSLSQSNINTSDITLLSSNNTSILPPYLLVL